MAYLLARNSPPRREAQPADLPSQLGPRQGHAHAAEPAALPQASEFEGVGRGDDEGLRHLRRLHHPSRPVWIRGVLLDGVPAGAAPLPAQRRRADPHGRLQALPHAPAADRREIWLDRGVGQRAPTDGRVRSDHQLFNDRPHIAPAPDQLSGPFVDGSCAADDHGRACPALHRLPDAGDLSPHPALGPASARTRPPLAVAPRGRASEERRATPRDPEPDCQRERRRAPLKRVGGHPRGVLHRRSGQRGRKGRHSAAAHFGHWQQSQQRLSDVRANSWWRPAEESEPRPWPPAQRGRQEGQRGRGRGGWLPWLRKRCASRELLHARRCREALFARRGGGWYDVAATAVGSERGDRRGWCRW
mmetsp:Transcript_7657/g.13967  ORF Transcript_7657/g.13967 Transcript_7657/m.13967 type:complete len:360 (-) Transcript_7657:117-1196(-)